ncbi:MAG: hypothetical protein M1155_00515 [Patescibacteria group bacterium]|nr:hypothetical protein [Patescibacteria group bacterium]
MNTNNQNNDPATGKNNPATGENNPATGENNPAKRILGRVRKILFIFIGTLAVIFIGLVIYRIPAAIERRDTKRVVDKINAQKITLADVMGDNLPSEPDPALKDATLEGVDANGNGIRDDVELAIFKLHPDSARIRAAELQYAKSLQNEMTSDVFNSDTLVAVMKQEDRGFFCISDVTPKDDKLMIAVETEARNLVLDNINRKNRHEEIFKKFMTIYKLDDGRCDIDLKLLPN